jgi:phosphonate utilization associated putative membrane protein
MGKSGAAWCEDIWSIELNAYLAIALSVALHVSWNLMARHAQRECDPLWWALAGHLALFGPWAIASLIMDAHWNNELVLALLVTSIANPIYFLALRKAYHYAPVALVYPLARSSPLLIALWAGLFFGVSTTYMGWLGLAIGSLGLLLLGWSARQGDMRHAVPFALLAALMTSIYSLSDKMAAPHLPNFASLMGFISVGYALSWLTFSALRYRETRRILPPCTPKKWIVLGGALAIGTAYALVVGAMRELPAAHVVSLTNLGIVAASLISLFVFGERSAWRMRLAAASLIVFGIVLLQSTL